VIIEEYSKVRVEQDALTSASDNAPYLIILSAKTHDRLSVVVEQFIDYLTHQENHNKVDLRQIEYTLQVGRQTLEVRLGLQVKSQSELIEKLNAYLNGEQNIGNLYITEVAESSQDIDNLNAYSDDLAAITSYIKERDYINLMKSWVKGYSVEWHRLYDGSYKPMRCSLPVYPFVKNRHWIDGDDRQIVVSVADKVIAPTDKHQANAVLPKLVEIDQMGEEVLHAQCVAYLKQVLADTLKMPSEQIDTTTMLEHYGVDSILVMQLMNVLRGDFPELDATLLVNYKTINALATYLVENYREALVGMAMHSQEHASSKNDAVVSIDELASELFDGKVDFSSAVAKIKKDQPEKVQ